MAPLNSLTILSKGVSLIDVQFLFEQSSRGGEDAPKRPVPRIEVQELQESQGRQPKLPQTGLKGGEEAVRLFTTLKKQG
eukprot:8081415-Pyramimonas_sp.AAC.1